MLVFCVDLSARRKKTQAHPEQLTALVHSLEHYHEPVNRYFGTSRLPNQLTFAHPHPQSQGESRQVQIRFH